MSFKNPNVIIDLKKVKKNIDTILIKTKKSNTKFRPHFKTHQSKEISELLKMMAIKSITVSSVEMALYFWKLGWQDICIAFPVNILEIDSINTLAKYITLHIIADQYETIEFLEKNITSKVYLWLDIETGYNRTGIKWNDSNDILK